MALTPDVQQKINLWLTGGYDSETKATLQQQVEANDEDALNDAFYRDLEFGTGGLRGVMGVGSNRMNRYTLGMAAQGLCNYAAALVPEPGNQGCHCPRLAQPQPGVCPHYGQYLLGQRHHGLLV